MKRRVMMKTVALAALASKAGRAADGSAGQSGLVGLWEFEDESEMGKATHGPDLEVVGDAPSHESIRADVRPGSPVDLGGVITTVHGVSNHLLLNHGIGANGGGRRVNEYSLVFDVLVPEGQLWRCFFQTHPENPATDDGEYFVRNNDNTLGRMSIGYTGRAVPSERWMRLVITADLSGGGHFRTYVDGELWRNHDTPERDSDFSLDPERLLLFADNDGENHPLVISAVALFSRALEAEEVAALGGPGLRIVPQQGIRPPQLFSYELPGEAATGSLVAVSLTAEDPDDFRVQGQIDWGNGEVSEWSGLFAAGEEMRFEHAWNMPGAFDVRARLRNENRLVVGWLPLGRIQVSGAPVFDVLTPPYLQNMCTDRMVVMLETVEDVGLVLEFGTTAALGVRVEMDRRTTGREQTSDETEGSFFHRGTLTGLRPGTEYHYRVATTDGHEVTEPSTFRTAPAGEEDFVFTAIGDVQTVNREWSLDRWGPAPAMFRHMHGLHPRFLLGLGDHAEDGNRYDRTRWSHLDRTAEVFGTRAPFFLAWGNHDGNSPQHPLRLSADQPSRWRSDRLSRVDPTPGFGSFTFSYGGVYVICLEHFACFTGGHNYIGDTAANDITNGWLDRALRSSEARRARFRVLAVHVPPFCERWIDGNSGLREHLVPRMERYNVDLCMSGHMHGYERGRINGVQYVISGGGSYLDRPTWGELHTNWNERLAHDRDFSHFKIDDDGWMGGYVDIDGVYGMEGERPGLLDRQPIFSGHFHGYTEVAVRGGTMTLRQHGFHADGSYIGVLDTVELRSRS